MFKKIAVFLLLVNIVTTLAVGYTVYKNFPTGKEYKIELDNPQNKEFEKNMYEGMSMLMQGQSRLVLNQQQLSLAMYRIHHFAEPHAEFHENCPECEIERQRTLSENGDSIATNK